MITAICIAAATLMGVLVGGCIGQSSTISGIAREEPALMNKLKKELIRVKVYEMFSAKSKTETEKSDALR